MPNDQAERAKEFTQRLRDIGVIAPEPAKAPAPEPAKTPAPAVSAPTTQPTEAAPGDKLVLEFKAFLQQQGMYHGNISSPDTDPEFVSAIKILESKIQTAIENVAPNSTAKIQGMIWQGDKINPQTSVADVVQTIRLIEQAKKRVKSGQATVDTFDTEEYQTQQPLAVKPNPNREDYNIETGDPDDTQQTGEMQAKLPETLPESEQGSGMDERVLELNRLMAKLKS